jgi:hypothetical protein
MSRGERDRGSEEGEMEEEDGRGGGRRYFIDRESGGGPVYAPCPLRWAPNPGGQTADLR